jgi:DNA-binding GntR family transcriptional regulator
VGNRTLALVAEVLDEVIDRNVDIAALALAQPAELLRRAIRSQQELLRYLEAGDADGAERHWKRHLEAAGSVVLGARSTDLVDGTSTAR